MREGYKPIFVYVPVDIAIKVKKIAALEESTLTEIITEFLRNLAMNEKYKNVLREASSIISEDET